MQSGKAVDIINLNFSKEFDKYSYDNLISKLVML